MRDFVFPPLGTAQQVEPTPELPRSAGTKAMLPEELVACLDQRTPLLIIDVRSLADYLDLHLQSSINVNLPTLLVKRFKRGTMSNFVLESFISTDAGRDEFRRIQALEAARRDRLNSIHPGDHSFKAMAHINTNTSPTSAISQNVNGLTLASPTDTSNKYLMSDIIVLDDEMDTNTKDTAGWTMLGVLELVRGDQPHGSISWINGGFNALKKLPEAQRFLVKGEGQGKGREQGQEDHISETPATTTEALVRPMFSVDTEKKRPQNQPRRAMTMKALSPSSPRSGGPSPRPTGLSPNSASPKSNQLSPSAATKATGRPVLKRIDTSPTIRSGWQQPQGQDPPATDTVIKVKSATSAVDGSPRRRLPPIITTSPARKPPPPALRIQRSPKRDNSPSSGSSANRSHSSDSRMRPPMASRAAHKKSPSMQVVPAVPTVSDKSIPTAAQPRLAQRRPSHQHTASTDSLPKPPQLPPQNTDTTLKPLVPQTHHRTSSALPSSIPQVSSPPQPTSPNPITPAPTTHPEAAFSISAIIPGFFYLGPEPSSKAHLDQLDALGIKRVLNMAAEIDGDEVEHWCRERAQGEDMQYLKCGLRDQVEATGVETAMEEAMIFLDAARAGGRSNPPVDAMQKVGLEVSNTAVGNEQPTNLRSLRPPCPVYVHCKAGKSRSVMIALAYLIHANKWPLSRAYAYVTDRRKGSLVNIGFVSELMRFEERELGTKSQGVVATNAGAVAAAAAKAGAPPSWK